jgi:Fe-Mn family superoxide dismutase
MMTRRTALQTIAGTAVLAATPRWVRAAPESAAVPPASTPSEPYTLAPLPFAADALEPHVDTATMNIHHGKHHAGYVQNLNKAIAAHPELGAPPVEILLRDLNAVPEDIRTAVRNHGGGHANHTLFWQCLAPASGGKPEGVLADALTSTFGGYDGFREKFTASAKSVFGSGWAWLSLDGQGNLIVETTPNQDSPISSGHHPLLGLDVWEHAYYLNYQNRRPDYIEAFFKIINWPFVQERYATLKA